MYRKHLHITVLLDRNYLQAMQTYFRNILKLKFPSTNLAHNILCI